MIAPFRPTPLWRSALKWGSAWLLSAAILLWLKWPMLNDPYWWDELGCYYLQASEMAHQPLHWLGSQPGMVRPLLFTGYIAAILRFISTSRPVIHGAVCLWVAACLPATAALVRTLGGSFATAGLAALLCLFTPLYFAQSSLVQTDLPTATLVTLAWLALLRRRTDLFVLLGCGAVLTKESGYFLCLPAAVLLYARAISEEGRRPFALTTFLRLWPAAMPGVMLSLWLCVHRVLTGHFMAGDHTDALGDIGALASAISHNFFEGGRIMLACGALCALIAAASRNNAGALSDRAKERRLAILCSGLLWVSLSLCFPAGLPRYMCLSLPTLTALAALGFARLRHATVISLLVMAGLVLLWQGESFHNNWGHHLESNLAYRSLLEAHRQTARALQEAGARSVVAGFPMVPVLNAGPEYGYLPAPILASLLPSVESENEVCRHDYVVDSAPEQASTKDLLARGYLTPWKCIGVTGELIGSRRSIPKWARWNHRLHIYRVTCPRELTAK